MKREGASGGGGSLSGISTSPAPSSEEYYKRSETKKWVLYAADWITVIIVTVISQLILIPWPLSNNFIASNPDIQQIHHDDDYGIDRISVVLSTAVPTVIIILWLGLLYRPLNELHRSILGLAMALSFCALFTSIFRQMSSILSSDFISLCRPTQEAYLRSVRFGTPISFDDCTNHDIKGSLHDYPMASITISSCSAGYLSLFASIQLGLRLHPQVMRQLKCVTREDFYLKSCPGQTLISFICLIPVAAAMAFPAIESRYHGGGHGWAYAFSIILGYIFAFWAHIIYCSDLSVALFLAPYR